MAEFADEIEHVIVGKQVEKIGAYAFDGLDKVTSVSFEDNSQLTEIEEYAFSGCKGITFVELPDKLEKIGEAAFSDCEKLAKVVLPKSLMSLRRSLSSLKTPKLSLRVNQ